MFFDSRRVFENTEEAPHKLLTQAQDQIRSPEAGRQRSYPLSHPSKTNVMDVMSKGVDLKECQVYTAVGDAIISKVLFYCSNHEAK